MKQYVALTFLGAMNTLYVSAADIGTCKMCNTRTDLRYGACYHCSRFVDGMQHNNGDYKLWDTRHPQNFWYARTQ